MDHNGNHATPHSEGERLNKIECSLADLDVRVRDLDKELGILATRSQAADGRVEKLANRLEVMHGEFWKFSETVRDGLTALTAKLTEHVIQEERHQNALLVAVVATLLAVLGDVVLNYLGK